MNKHSKWTLALTCLGLLGVFGMIGCEACEEPVAAPEPAPVAAPARVCGPANDASVRGYRPSGERGHSAVLIEKSAPEEVRVGNDFTYTLKVTNITRADLLDVVVTDQLPAKFKLTSTTPAATADGSKLVWRVGTLKAGESRTFLVKGQATGEGTLNECADVTFRSPPVCLAIRAVQPGLTLTKTAPGQVMICDTIPVRLVLKNTGTGTICNVVVTDPLPEGLTTTDGKKVVTFRVAELAEGQEVVRTFNVKATRTRTI